MKKIQLVIDLVLDDADILRLENNKPGYLYTKQSNSLYLKHINHIDYHAPFIVISYGRENHQIINLETNTKKNFLINHENLDDFHSVAVGVTEEIAMIALGDSYHTKIQIVNVEQPLKVHLNTIYMEDEGSFFPVPRYFTGTPTHAVLVYSDNSQLALDLETFEIGQRIEAEKDRIIKGQTVLSPDLSILGPFIILTITNNMKKEQLKTYKHLIKRASQTKWIAIDDYTVIHSDLITTQDFDDEIAERRKQITQLLEILEEA